MEAIGRYSNRVESMGPHGAWRAGRGAHFQVHLRCPEALERRPLRDGQVRCDDWVPGSCHSHLLSGRVGLGCSSGVAPLAFRDMQRSLQLGAAMFNGGSIVRWAMNQPGTCLAIWKVYLAPSNATKQFGS